jgi:hypothetical protein
MGINIGIATRHPVLAQQGNGRCNSDRDRSDGGTTVQDLRNLTRNGWPCKP